MRKLFSHQLIEARHEMLSIFEALDLTLHDAVRAFLTDDTELAAKAREETLHIDARCENLEVVCYNLISMQGPMASDFRTLQTINFVNYNLQRICDKVRRIARAARKKVKADIDLPSELADLIERQASDVYRVLGLTISALVNSDMTLARALIEQDEPVHEMYERFFRAYNRIGAEQLAGDSSLDDLRRVIMVARYLDRIASISIDAASRITFMLTGQRWSLADVADADTDELEDMRIPSGEGTILNPARDARFVARVPLDEVDEQLAEHIRRLNDGSEDHA
ncbi:phosphate uptake regulator PhoU [Collinsella sp. AGMB00827]|uniref:Phosphate uptake regulator PhoU n=1 Tax=Collinsella ureilytica TaxID=2869515 RepID=A0ABS7MKM0_9ACTN|nr:phosphate uptake regulator PhoU [Collinsella urealyticum]MBY4797914.1 phosphate uptake regulator PhoU [Collinsella urealyticum]